MILKQLQPPHALDAYYNFMLKAIVGHAFAKSQVDHVLNDTIQKTYERDNLPAPPPTEAVDDLVYELPHT